MPSTEEQLAARVASGVDAMLALLLPLHCASCGRAVERSSRSPICGACWSRLLRLAWPRCERCGHPVTVRDVPSPASPGPRRCRWCDLLPPFVRAVRSVCWVPDGTGGAIVHALKYHDWTNAAVGMAACMAHLDWPQDVVEERRALVPVPLATDRERERGYNQSALIARALGEHWCCPAWEDVLVRVRSTESQTRLTPGDRLRNVAGAFRAVPSARPRLRGAHVVLVDDVVTTGATLNACAAALILGGARIVSYVTFGRARS
jgi:ComF family protein